MAEDRDDAPRRPATERADELLSRAGQTAGIFASLVGMRVARVAAFAREEVEDMWAEARSIRQQATEAEANGDVTSRASEGVDVSERSRSDAEEGEPEKSVESEGEAETGVATSTHTTPEAEAKQDAEPGQEAKTGDYAVKPGDYVGAAGSKAEESNAGSDEIKATEAARRRAEELGVDLREVEGTGSNGQITVDDVRKQAGSKT